MLLDYKQTNILQMPTKLKCSVLTSATSWRVILFSTDILPVPKSICEISFFTSSISDSGFSWTKQYLQRRKLFWAKIEKKTETCNCWKCSHLARDGCWKCTVSIAGEYEWISALLSSGSGNRNISIGTFFIKWLYAFSRVRAFIASSLFHSFLHVYRSDIGFRRAFRFTLVVVAAKSYKKSVLFTD